MAIKGSGDMRGLRAVGRVRTEVLRWRVELARRRFFLLERGIRSVTDARRGRRQVETTPSY